MNDPTQRPPLAERIRNPKWWKARLAFVPTLIWNFTLSRVLRLRNWWDPIDDHVLVGAFPFPEDVDALASEGVVGVVNTCEEYRGPRKTYAEAGIEQLYIPTIDFTPPSLAAVDLAVEFIDRYVDAGGKVYVHCKAGRGRSATVAACWLISRRNMSPAEAQAHLVHSRSHVSRHLAEREVVQEYYRRRLAEQQAQAQTDSAAASDRTDA